MINPFEGVVPERRVAVESFPDLQVLANRLHELLLPVQGRPITLPIEKALLSRDGGVCAVDGARLVFDPLQPHQHRCPVCHASYAGVRHHRAWSWRYHLWLSERAIHGALLAALGVSAVPHRQWCERVLHAYTENYSSYPNQDNVLGPTRLFFSTYMESIWLLQLVVATMLLDLDGVPVGDGLRSSLEDMVDESSNLIASYDEGLSNRQVWNSAAVLAAGLFLDDEKRIHHGISGAHGVESLLARGVTPQGRWHEGENYHLFALRGFLLAAELSSAVGKDFYADDDRLGLMYTAPVATLLPDFTLAARGDSPYGVSIRQPRFAELWEIGFARTRASLLASLLSQLYAGNDVQHEIGLAEIAEVEQNQKGAGLVRTGLGWKALLWMTPAASFGSEKVLELTSTLIEPTGPVVMRTKDGRYVGLEGRGTGSGHGHPDRLHLTVFDREPVLTDFGTGSYVDTSLHWYRSWRSHNVPEKQDGDGRTGRADCVAFEQSENWQWCRASLYGFAGNGSTINRSVLVGPEYIVDVVDVQAPADVEVDLPVHVLGYEIDPNVSSQGQDVLLLVSGVPDRGEVVSPARVGEARFLAEGPGPPPLDFGNAKRIPYMVRRCQGSGRWVHVFSRSPGHVLSVTTKNDDIAIGTTLGQENVRVDSAGVEVVQGNGLVRLSGFRSVEMSLVDDRPKTRQMFVGRKWRRLPTDSQLGQLLAQGHQLTGDHYRRSEQPYPGVNHLSAKWCMYAHETHVVWVIDVQKSDPFFRATDAEDPNLDNEYPDIHSDGVQVYFGDMFDCDDDTESWVETWRGYLIVPDASVTGRARVHSVGDVASDRDNMDVTADIRADGFRVTVSVEVSEIPNDRSAIAFDVVVNEMYQHRERRCGQLALSGGGWVYLRGDRESPATASVGRFK